jgi:hypothetical protein
MSGEQAIREKQIPRGFGRINNVLDELDKEIATYGDMLQPILTPPTPEKVGEGNLKTKESLAPLADTLDAIENRIRSFRNQLQYLRQRTEI